MTESVTFIRQPRALAKIPIQTPIKPSLTTIFPLKNRVDDTADGEKKVEKVVKGISVKGWQMGDNDKN